MWRNLRDNRQEMLITILSASLAVGILVLIVLIDVSRWPLRLRPHFQPPAPITAPDWPVPTPKPQAPTPTPPAATPPSPEPPLPPCAGDRTSPRTVRRPAPSAVDYGGKPFGPGRRYLEGDDPAFSPDGSEVAFAKDQEIWISGVNGRNLRRITEGSEPAWSPDGSRIAFTFEGNIWVISPSGSNRKPLTGAARNREATWSPDGSQIAFTSDREGISNIWIMEADGSSPRRVTDLSGPRWATSASFSPDGRRFVFSGRPPEIPSGSRRSKLMIINTDGTELCQLTQGDFDDEDPDWSARGIVFYSYRHPPDGSIWIVQPDGSDLEQLPGTYGSEPAWSPDSTRIAYSDSTKIEVFNLLDRSVRALTQLSVVPLHIYIKPGLANTINPKAERSIPVAILSAPWFDPVRQIDQTSIRFGPPGAGRPPVTCAPSDVNGDGLLDLVCHFDVAGFSAGQTEGVLKATGVDEILFEGRDTVRVVPAR